MVRRLLARRSCQTAATLILAVLAGAFVEGRASAGIIFGSGERQSSNPAVSGFSLDANWTVVATPAGPASPNLILDPNYSGIYGNSWYGWTATDWTPPNTGSPSAGYVQPSPGYAAYIPADLPGVFYGMGHPGDWAMYPQPGISVDGTTYNWISPTPNAYALFGSPYNQSDYTWIVAQTFVVDIPFNYDFTFQASGDNAIQFFIGGTVSTGLQDATAFATNGYWSDSVHPTIVGGTALTVAGGGTYWNNFGQLGTFTGTGYLTSGTHTAYMVLHDTGGLTAAFISQASFEVSGVPEIDPTGIGSVLSLVLGSLGLLERRRMKAA